jgi:predicted porin
MRDDIFQREDADRRAEAEFALRSLGNLTLRLSDWQQNQISNDSAAREFGIRYAYGDGSGLGLSFEYSQREHLSQDAQKEWRIGFTYR